jgi:hypothetical protein
VPNSSGAKPFPSLSVSEINAKPLKDPLRSYRALSANGARY